jgi:hypothetical protein
VAAPRVSDSLGGPIYNAETNSYFQLFNHPNDAVNYNWAEANARAIRKSYKGKKGRLAIVKDRKTLEFVRENFPLTGETWIGAKLFCKYRMLMWVDGDIQAPKSAGMWHRQWFRTRKINCDQGLSGRYMPIYLTKSGDGPALWQASGPAKSFKYYLVEYPAPKKSKDVSQSSNDQDMTVPAGASTTE